MVRTHNIVHSLFHPAVAEWFTNTYATPTDVQAEAWQHIAAGHHTLISAPTGSGKTLAAFLAVIDRLLRQHIESGLPNGTLVVYVSPLKALSNDIERNLQRPVQGISQALKNLYGIEFSLSVGLRTGDTSPSERAHNAKYPPHILVTTPESLYLLLTSKNGRKALSSVHTLILDEIHAVVNNKRGSHLALSVQRLQNLLQNTLQRIGISATQKPLELVAHYLTGCSHKQCDVKEVCKIVNTGHRRNMEISIELPSSPLSAVMSNEVWTEVYSKIIELIEQHRTTLIFVNNRRLSERISHHLQEVLGEDSIMAHHGSMSKEHRLNAEQKLKAGELRAIVATASLELGIDIGSVDLVCQIGSIRSISGFLQRIGRSGHYVWGKPRGAIFPLTRDELIEAVALLDALRRSELDQITIPQKPIDILAQQIVAEVCCNEYCDLDELYQLFSAAYPYKNLTLQEFESIVRMLSEGYTTKRGRRGAYLFLDEINRKIKPRKGAKLAALLNGGAIPDLFDYDIILQPENIFIGTLNEDFAIDSSPGDIFQLGNNSWKILSIQTGKVYVEDAKGQPPSIPFWIGEAPSRTDELSLAVSRVRKEISDAIGTIPDMNDTETNEILPHWAKSAVDKLMQNINIPKEVAEQTVLYIALGKAALKHVPTQDRIVMERFFDEAGDMHLVIHSCYGSRINKAWGLALRKKFCRKFNFELQAAANENAIILSLGATHSFPLEEVFRYLHPDKVRDVLVQALLDAPVFANRWRWNATRALAVLKRRPSGKVPPQIQRSQSEDLVALIFPDQLACLENISGEREIPNHPLVQQTIEDCLTEWMDIEGLEKLITRIWKGEISLHALDLREPSPFAHEIITAKPYAFLDNAALEERRTNAIQTRGLIDIEEAKTLAKLDEQCVYKVQLEAWPQAATSDELHDALILCGFITEQEGIQNGWQKLFNELVKQRRATCVNTPTNVFWVAAERLPQIRSVYTEAVENPLLDLPEAILKNEPTEDVALAEIIRSRLEVSSPVTEQQLCTVMGLSHTKIYEALLNLENQGFVFRGNFSPHAVMDEWCERRLLARMHQYTLSKLRKEIEAVSPSEYMRFLFAWHHMGESDVQLAGPESLKKVIEMLEGFEAQAAAWEAEILPARVADYDYIWLDVLCLSGFVTWGRFFMDPYHRKDKRIHVPIKTTPITLVKRENVQYWRSHIQPVANYFNKLSKQATLVYEHLKKHGAKFFSDIEKETRLLKVQLESALEELVATCLVTSDSYTGLRALLVPDKFKTESAQRRKSTLFSMENAGRWSLLISEENEQSISSLYEQKHIEYKAKILLKRYGIVCRRIVERESLAPLWRELVTTYRRMEAKGEIRGGRFVSGMWGEQFALPEAITLLRNIKKNSPSQSLVSISAADPLNLTGIVTPGKRVPALYTNRVVYRNGVPVAIKEGKEIYFLTEFKHDEKRIIKETLIRRKLPEHLKIYAGKSSG
ncbi:MAG: DEAD/DEAH box helicase [Cytophagaceae bacterium]|nr:DEAD/DEAH box helicase [Cytophagaceae bacterium]MDW8456586.1 DEAD/DEAH box helicase [Cytophagaceae bacterium]